MRRNQGMVNVSIGTPIIHQDFFGTLTRNDSVRGDGFITFLFAYGDIETRNRNKINCVRQQTAKLSPWYKKKSEEKLLRKVIIFKILLG